MANPLPTVNGDSGTWGQKLNDFLSTEHNALDGTHGLATGLVTDVVNPQTIATSPYAIPAPTSAGIHDLTLNVSCTLTFPTATAGQSFTLFLRQGTGGSKLITWPASGILKWAGGTAPTLTTALGSVDVLGFCCVNSLWYGFVSGQDMK